MSGPPGRIPVTVIGGYLGAGKTTLVNHLLRHADGLKLAVLVNDFGALPIDADLIEGRDGNVIAIAGGCVCCSYGSDMMQALIDLAERTPRPEHVLLETSGVALPGPVAGAVTLLADYVIDGVVVLADAETVRRHGADPYLADTISRQLADAQIVLLNKTDLSNVATLSETERWIADKAPHARIVPTEQSRAPIDVLLGSRLGYHPSSGLHIGERHGFAYATEAFELTDPLDVTALAAKLANPALGLLRAKGVARDLDGAFRVMQVVGNRADVTMARGDDDRVGKLVVIGLKSRIDKAALTDVIAASRKL
jgi:G3E family GTPase